MKTLTLILAFFGICAEIGTVIYCEWKWRSNQEADMILIHTMKGVIEMPCPPAGDAGSIQGRCQHRVSLFDNCFECVWMETEQQRHHSGCTCMDCRPSRSLWCFVPNCADPSCRLDHTCGCAALDSTHTEADHE